VIKKEKAEQRPTIITKQALGMSSITAKSLKYVPGETFCQQELDTFDPKEYLSTSKTKQVGNFLTIMSFLPLGRKNLRPLSILLKKGGDVFY